MGQGEGKRATRKEAESSGSACSAQHPVCLLEERSPRLPRLCPLLPPEVTLSLWLPALLGAHSFGERRAGECPWTALAQEGGLFLQAPALPGEGLCSIGLPDSRAGEREPRCMRASGARGVVGPGSCRDLRCAPFGGLSTDVLSSHGCSRLTRLRAPRDRKLDPTPPSRGRSSQTLLLPSC